MRSSKKSNRSAEFIAVYAIRKNTAFFLILAYGYRTLPHTRVAQQDVSR